MTNKKRGKAISLDYLKLTPKQAEASDGLNYAIDNWKSSVRGGKLNCELDPDRWTGYDERLVPLPEEVEDMCGGCPVLEACEKFARTLKPDGVVMGGNAWVDGKVQA